MTVSRNRLWRDTRGAAYTEAVIALPVFIVVFAGILALNAYYSAKLESMSEARANTWQIANGTSCASTSGCSADSGAGCIDQEEAVLGDSSTGGLYDLFNCPDSICLGTIPGVLPVFNELFGGSDNGSGSFTVDVPAMFGGSSTMNSTMTLACNPEGKTVGRLMADVIGETVCGDHTFSINDIPLVGGPACSTIDTLLNHVAGILPF